ncbi:hypothetical protein RUM43_013029 [Polyplax serrata]|uniref:E3 SUMO-protein ligase NSE2 n=1 Tax=Polyplax serrata TaxID=468196 RepID=A0AAN8NWF0_POLSC
MSDSPHIYHQSLEVIERLAKHLIQGKTDVEILRQLPSHILNFTKCLTYNEARNKIYNSYIAKVDSALSLLDPDEILSAFDKEVEQIDREKLARKSEQCKKLLELIKKHTTESSDEEILTISENINNLDPITKLPINEPVKNVKCGHIYEKTSIMELIKMNPMTKCPIPGCTASDCVRPKDLVPDHSLKRMLSEKSSEGRQKKMKVLDVSI